MKQFTKKFSRIVLSLLCMVLMAFPSYAEHYASGETTDNVFCIVQDAYSITYELSGGTIEGAKTYYKTGDGDYIPPDPVRTGYDFTEWTPESILSGSTGNVTFTAGWKAKEIVITYDLDGGTWVTGYEAPDTHTYGTTTELPSSSRLYKSGYVFAGWELGGERVHVIDALRLTDVSLTALWKTGADTVLVNGETFNQAVKYLANGTDMGTSDTDHKIVRIERSMTPAPEDAETRTLNGSGEAVTAWAEDDADGTVIHYYTAAASVQANQDSSYMFAGLAALESIGLEMDMSQVTEIDSMYAGCNALSHSMMVGSGYVSYADAFDGCSADAGTEFVIYYSDGYKDLAKDVQATRGGGDHVWLATQDISYDLGGGAFASSYIAPSMKNYGESVELPGEMDMIRNGYGFLGWYADAEFTGDALTEVPADQNEDITYYAKWEPKGSVVRYDANGGTFGESETNEVIYHKVSGTETVTKVLHTNSYDDDGNDVEDYSTSPDLETYVTIPGAESLNVYLEYRMGPSKSTCINFYQGENSSGTRIDVIRTLEPAEERLVELTVPGDTVAIYTTGGAEFWARISADVAETSIETISGSEETPVREGYTFQGWYISPTCTDGTEFTLEDDLGDEVMVYAKWKFDGVTVTYDANGGTFGESETNEVLYQKFVEERTVAESMYTSGYDYGGKFIGSAPANYFDLGFATNLYSASIPGAESLSVNMKFYDPGDAYIMYASTEGGLTSGQSADLGGTVSGEGELKFEIEGDTVWFLGITNFTPTATIRNFTYPAYYVTVEAVLKDTEVKIFSGTEEIPTREGYIFQGWYTSPACTDGMEFTLEEDLGDEVTVYAKWMPVASLLLDANGGTFDDGSTVMSLGEQTVEE